MHNFTDALYVENIFSEALDNIEAELKVNGSMLNNFHYANDTVIPAINEKVHQILLNTINDAVFLLERSGNTFPNFNITI